MIKIKLVESYEEGDYTVNVYDNGTREKYPTAFPPRIVQPPFLTEMEQVTLETAANVEMIAAFAELG